MLTRAMGGPSATGWVGWDLRPALAADAGVLAYLCAAHAAYEQIPHDAEGHAERLARALEDGRLHAWLYKNCEVASETLSGEQDLKLEVFMTDDDVARLKAMAPEISVRE